MMNNKAVEETFDILHYIPNKDSIGSMDDCNFNSTFNSNEISPHTNCILSNSDEKNIDKNNDKNNDRTKTCSVSFIDDVHYIYYDEIDFQKNNKEITPKSPPNTPQNTFIIKSDSDSNIEFKLEEEKEKTEKKNLNNFRSTFQNRINNNNFPMYNYENLRKFIKSSNKYYKFTNYFSSFDYKKYYENCKKFVTQHYIKIGFGIYSLSVAYNYYKLMYKDGITILSSTKCKNKKIVTEKVFEECNNYKKDRLVKSLFLPIIYNYFMEIIAWKVTNSIIDNHFIDYDC